jgi:hypothetical protein
MARHFWVNNSLAAISWRITWGIGFSHLGQVAIVPLSEFGLGQWGEKPENSSRGTYDKTQWAEMALMGQSLN